MNILKKFELNSSPDHSIGSILFLGDTCTLNISQVHLSPNNLTRVISKEMLEQFKSSSFSVVNLEGPLTNVTNPIKKNGPHLLSYPETAGLLKNCGIKIATIANNHILDHGQEGLEDTIKNCQKNGIAAIGAGNSFEKAHSPYIFKMNNLKLAFLAFTEKEFSTAGSSSSGAAEFFLPNVYQEIQKIRPKCSVLILCIHGGTMYYPIPNPNIQKYYRFLIDAGADAVIASHPHTIQGIEIYKNAPIIYSLGTFLFPLKQKHPGCWDEGLIAKIIFGVNGISALEIYPCCQNGSIESTKVSLFSPEKTKNYRQTFERLCQIAASENLVREFWASFCKYKSSHYFDNVRMSASSLKLSSWVKPLKRAIVNKDISYAGDLMSELFTKISFKKQLKEKKMLFFYNLIACPARCDVIITALENHIFGNPTSSDVEQELKELMVNCNVKTQKE